MALNDLTDKLLSYGLGSGVAVSSQALQAQTSETMPLMSVPLPIGITVGDVCTVIATLAVVVKGALDYLSYRRKSGK